MEASLADSEHEATVHSRPPYQPIDASIPTHTLVKALGADARPLPNTAFVRRAMREASELGLSKWRLAYRSRIMINMRRDNN